LTESKSGLENSGTPGKIRAAHQRAHWLVRLREGLSGGFARDSVDRSRVSTWPMGGCSRG